MLQCKKLGGHHSYGRADLIDQKAWADGRQAMLDGCIEFCTSVACLGHHEKGRHEPLEPKCAKCGQLKYKWTGTRGGCKGMEVSSHRPLFGTP